MEQLDVFVDAKGSDEAIDGFPDPETSPSTGAVDLGGVFKCCQSLYPQDGIQQEEALRSLKCHILSDLLQDLAEDEIRMRQRSPRCDELLQVVSSGVPAPLKKSIQTVVSTTITRATSASPQDLLPTGAALGV
jgi:hypothetical protein